MTERKESKLEDRDVKIIAILVVAASLLVGGMYVLGIEGKLGFPAVPSPKAHSLIHPVN